MASWVWAVVGRVVQWVWSQSWAAASSRVTSTNGGAFSGIGHVSGETAGSTPKSILIRNTAITLSACRRFLLLGVVH